jgi:hypothetical protein
MSGMPPASGRHSPTGPRCAGPSAVRAASPAVYVPVERGTEDAGTGEAGPPPGGNGALRPDGRGRVLRRLYAVIAVPREGVLIMRITRRRLLGYGLGAGAALTVPWASRIPMASAARSGKLTKYIQPVPLPGRGIVVATPSGSDRYSFPRRRSRGSFIRTFHRRPCGPMTTAQGSPVSQVPSGWPW